MKTLVKDCRLSQKPQPMVVASLTCKLGLHGGEKIGASSEGMVSTKAGTGTWEGSLLVF